MKNWFNNIAAGLTLLISQTVAANYGLSLQQNQEAYWASQRQAYSQALDLLTKGQRKQFQKQAEKLRDYPLYPYLKYKEYSRYISSVDHEELDEFIHDFSDSPLASWLRKRWIRNLARQKNWDTYLNHYQVGQYGTEFDCHYYWALYKEGDRNEAFAGARRLWLVGKSQHDACDPLFEVWKTTGEMHGELAWERTALAMANGQIQLAKYLESKVPKQKKVMAREWRDLYRDPHRLKYLPRYQKWGDNAKPLIVTGFSRLIRKDPKLAQALWPKYQAEFQFNLGERAKIINEFAWVLAVRKQENADYWLNQAAQYGLSDDLTSVGLRNALYAEDWPRVRNWLALLNQDQADENSWKYWRARTQQKLPPVDLNKLSQVQVNADKVDYLNFLNHFRQALYQEGDLFELLPRSVVEQKFAQRKTSTSLLKDLAKNRHYYGFLASERLQQPLSLNMEMTPVNEQDISRVTQLPGVQRARELHLLDSKKLSRYEWQHLVRRSDEKDRAALAQLAHLWGWHNPAIVAAYQSNAFNDLSIRFPVAYQSVIQKHAGSKGLDLDWVYSLIRQESAFLYSARSAVGAMGMMQIMPATARQISREMGIRNPSTKQMLTPDANVRLGTYYMSQLLEEFSGNMILATAAYNAGPHRARAWRPKTLPVSGDIWVETIPFHETRDYVKNILTYQAIYRHHLGKPAKLSNALRVIHPEPMQVSFYSNGY